MQVSVGVVFEAESIEDATAKVQGWKLHPDCMVTMQVMTNVPLRLSADAAPEPVATEAG